ncbi:MAG: hypothetical protein AAFX99_23825, partial [Myxococcota bacterium]
LMQPQPSQAILQQLLGMHNPAFRALAAPYLSPKTPEHLDAIRALLTDPSPTTRRLALHVLTRDPQAPWWLGWFRSNPLRPNLSLTSRQRDHVLAIRHCVTTEALSAADKLIHLAPHLRELPDTLITECALFALIDLQVARNEGRALGTQLLTCRGGLQVAALLLQSWAQQSDIRRSPDTLAAFMSELPRDIRLQRCLDMLHLATNAPEQERALPDAPPALFAAVVARAWPAERNPTPVLDAIDASHPPTHPELLNAVAMNLIEVLPRLDPSNIPWGRLLALSAHGFEGPWATAEHQVETLLSHTAPAHAYRLMRQLLDQGPERASRWAMERMAAQQLWSSSEPTELLEAWLNHPPHRRLLFATPVVVQAFLEPLRAMLTKGRCSWEEAISIMRSLRHKSPNSFIASVHECIFAHLNPEVPCDPPKQHEGPTPQEWKAWRLLRDQRSTLTHDDWATVLSLLPSPPSVWSAADHNLLDRAWAHRSTAITIPLAAALTIRHTDHDQERLTQLLNTAEGHTKRMLEALAHSNTP